MHNFPFPLKSFKWLKYLKRTLFYAKAAKFWLVYSIGFYEELLVYDFKDDVNQEVKEKHPLVLKHLIQTFNYKTVYSNNNSYAGFKFFILLSCFRLLNYRLSQRNSCLSLMIKRNNIFTKKLSSTFIIQK